MVRITDRPDMTLDVYRGRKTTMQQQQQPSFSKYFSHMWTVGGGDDGRLCAMKSRSRLKSWGWSGGAMVLGKLPVPGRPTIWIQ